MKRKGFTLVELLAVIVILAIIAIIATPMIMGVIEKSRKGAAEASANHYIDALELYFIEELGGTSTLKPSVNYYVTHSTNVGGTVVPAINDLVGIKGSKPEGPNDYILLDEKYGVKSAILTINGYEIEIENGKISSSEKENDKIYQVTFNEKIKETNNRMVIFDDIDITGYTNLTCNNGATIEYNERQVIVSNIRSDITCKENTTLKETIEGLDSSLNTILMVNDETSEDSYTLSNVDVVFNLNGKKIISNKDSIFNVENGSNLTINDPNNEGYMIGHNYIIFSKPGSNTIINGGNYIAIGAINEEEGHQAVFGNYYDADNLPSINKNGKLILNHVNILSNYEEVSYNSNGFFIYYGLDVEINNSNIDVSRNAIANNSFNNSTVTINNSKIISTSNEQMTIAASTKDANIKINNSYIANLGAGRNIAVGDGTVEVNGEEAILDQNENYVSGTYIYSANSSSIYVNKGIVTINGGTINSPSAIWNGEGKIYINNGNIKGGFVLGTSSNDGYYYINNGKFQPGNNSLVGTSSNGRGKIYICNGLFSEYEKGMIKNESPNVFIYYKDSVTFENAESPSITGTYSSQVIKDDTITCK